MKVLYLTQWYPHRYDAMAGLFVRNHAEAAVRQGIDVCVLYCHPVSENPSGEEIEVVEQTTNRVREVYVYHTCSAFTALLRGRDEVFLRWGMPDLCQVNVLSKNALLAYELFLRWRIPYVIMEHWSGYLPANGDYLSNTSSLQRVLYQHVARKAKCILPVSAMLKKSMQACGIRNNRWQLLHNVVADSFYHPFEPLKSQPSSREVFSLLHVSCFDEKAKNVRGILRAIQLLKERRSDFHLTLVGTGVDFESDKVFAEQLGLSDVVSYTGELPPELVCLAMQQAHLFILFSRYENAPVVLSECLAVGLPVVASNVGGIPEMINSDTGVLVQSEDVNALADAIDRTLNRLPAYKPEVIRTYGQKYSYENVGKQLKALYESVLS